MSAWLLDEKIADHARATPEAPAVGTPSGWCTYRELEQRIDWLAGSLQHAGVERGTFVLNLLPGGIPSAVAGLAIQRTGACLIEVNRDWGPALIGRIASATGARHAVLLSRDARLLGSIGVDWNHLWVVHPEAPGSAVTECIRTVEVTWVDPRGSVASPHPLYPVERSADDLALLLYTSATTSDPRGVMLTGRNIAANSDAIVQYLSLTAADRVMSILPLSYSYGRSLLQTHLSIGASIFFDHRFMYPRKVLDAIAVENCTGFAGVPLTFEVLRRNCDPRLIAMPCLRYVTQAGGGMAPDLRLWVREAFAPAVFFIMYGQTEATARLAYLPPDRLPAKPTAIGVPIPGVELRVVDDDGHEVPHDTVGHLVARGANVSSGYFGAPEETREILKDGWLWTGDLARRDADGDLYIVGRSRTMLKVAGHRFAPEEVEERLTAHPAVREACVVAGPDPFISEAAWAFVVLDEQADEAALRRFCAEALPTYKVPRTVVVLDALPRSAAGKIQRGRLTGLANALSHPI